MPTGFVAFRGLEANEIVFPPHGRAFGPEHPCAGEIHFERFWYCNGVRLDATLQGRILLRYRVSDVEHVADAQSLDLHCRRQNAIQLEFLETFLAPDNGKFLTGLEQVDVLAVANDVHAMDDKVAVERLPVQLHCSHPRQRVS